MTDAATPRELDGCLCGTFCEGAGTVALLRGECRSVPGFEKRAKKATARYKLARGRGVPVIQVPL